MRFNKSTGLLVFVVLLAFSWGYKREEIGRFLADPSRFFRRSSNPPPATADSSSLKDGSLKDRAVPPASTDPRALPVPLPTAALPSNLTARAPDLALHPAPKSYSEYMSEHGKKVGPGTGNTLANTLDSIRPGEVDSAQVDRRNAYFDKLSQQLQELKGEPPPKNTPAPVPSAGPEFAPLPANPYAPYAAQIAPNSPEQFPAVNPQIPADAGNPFPGTVVQQPEEPSVSGKDEDEDEEESDASDDEVE